MPTTEAPPGAAPSLASGRPAWKRWLRPVWFKAKGLYRQVLLTQPSAAFFFAGVRSRLAADRFPDTPTPEKVGDCWSDLPRERHLPIARAIRTIEYRNQDLRALMRYAGIGALTRVVRPFKAERLQRLHAEKRPTMLVGWHFRTPYFMTIAALQRLGLRALIVGYIPGEFVPPGFEVLSPNVDDPARRVLVLKRALSYLSAGGIVYTCVDHTEGNSVTHVPFLGRSVTVRKGFASLARLSGAAVIPTSQRWAPRGRTVDVTFHGPITVPAGGRVAGPALEDALVRETIGWVESHARAHPEELYPESVVPMPRRPERRSRVADAPPRTRFDPGTFETAFTTARGH